MNQQPDKFFRDKLDRYQRPAPTGAWNKIEAGLAKKNKRPVPWLAIAASLLLLAAAAFLFWPEKKNIRQPKHFTAEQEDIAPAPAPKNILPESDPAVVGSKPSDEPKKIVPSRKSTPRGKEKIRSKAPAETVTVADAGAEKPVIIVPDESSEIERPSTQQPVVTNATPSTAQSRDQTVQDQNIKLVFSAAESEEYLDKKSLAEATSSGKKSSTLKKLLKKAEDLTTNQDPFGELRQKKNEILALNFKTDKQRGQNK